MQTPEQRVWFITGTSSGFGKRLVESVLARGDYVIATVRNLEKVSVLQADHARLHTCVLDVTDSEEVLKTKIQEAIAVWGRIDVLVNNAGSAPKCLVEEGGSKAALAQFNVNFFGLINVTNAVLPHMRERRSGTVILMGSRSVWKADMILSGFYIASKAAVHALSEALAAELAEFGVHVLLVAPGSFRTENVHNAPYWMNHHVSAYDSLRETEMAKFQQTWKQAKGDPEKAMELLVDVVRGEGKAQGKALPSRLLLGKVTYIHVRAHCTNLLETLNEWEDVAKDLDYGSSKE